MRSTFPKAILNGICFSRSRGFNFVLVGQSYLTETIIIIQFFYLYNAYYCIYEPLLRNGPQFCKISSTLLRYIMNSIFGFCPS